MRVSFRTYGCRLNQAESEGFVADFTKSGWTVVAFPAPADVVVIHGCAVTRTAEQECLSLARGMKRAARRNGSSEPFVVLVGCVVEASAAHRAVAGVDLIVPRENKNRLAAVVQTHVAMRTPDAHARTERLNLSDTSKTRMVRAVRHRALLKVQDGCDFFCAYCIVPHTRGAPVSLPWQQVLDEARALALAGFSELVITGCNLACYRDGTRGLPDLIAALAAMEEVPRIRLGSIEPATCEQDVLALMEACRKICRHLHLPLQSGDAETLRRMRRRYTPEAFVCRHRASGRAPSAGLSSARRLAS